MLRGITALLALATFGLEVSGCNGQIEVPGDGWVDMTVEQKIMQADHSMTYEDRDFEQGGETHQGIFVTAIDGNFDDPRTRTFWVFYLDDQPIRASVRETIVPPGVRVTARRETVS
ncbi:MAG: DUF4430 domain-containing protein [Patescibacteria group bacterium]|nr:hypothetical protein [Patescibacteria group bacterium]